MLIKQLKDHKQENDFTAFYTVVETYVPEVRRFIANSLKRAENEGQLDRGYYNPDDILDEVYLSIFSEFDPAWDEKMLRYYLLKKGIDQLEEKRSQEASTHPYVDTGELLKEELDRLKEDFTTDGDGDLILNTELDDISYKQERQRRTRIFIDEAVETLVMEKLKLDRAFQLSSQRRANFGYLFTTIPRISKTILELHAYADQSPSEIALILDMEKQKVDRVLRVVTERFKSI